MIVGFYCKHSYISLWFEERNGYSFLKSVCCLSGLGIVGKNRRISKQLNRKKLFVISWTHCFYIVLCSFFTIL